MGKLITREDAISDIQVGRGIMLTFQGMFTTYRVILRRDADDHGKVEAVYEDLRYRMIRKFHITPSQVESYIERWYPRAVSDNVVVSS